MARHHVHTQSQASVDHVLPFGPQGGGRALPGVAPIEQERAGTRSLKALDQRGQVRKTAHPSVAPGRLLEIQMGERVGEFRACPHVGKLEQVVAHQMRQLAAHVADADVDIGLPEMDRQQLRVAVGHVQKRHLPKPRHVVQRLPSGLRVGFRVVGQGHSCAHARPQDLQELSLG